MDGVKASLSTDQRIVRELIAWHLAASDPPNDEETVLVYAPDADEPVWLGWRSDGVWYDVSGAPMPYRVHSWAGMPSGGVP